ncbi:MAG: hypothetical protein CMM46_02830 [Rhodospirillaceae bacterium]|nr:hypothetical protein [Rhodospirillaceae bacterium]|tara:strand:+ start:233 stop:1669 length:1437 start_codon:yes stop_codon:yes gene_type:complete
MAITDSMIQTAMSHLRAGARGEAAKVLRDVCRIEPSHIRAHCMLAIVTYQDGDSGGALAILDELESRHPDKPEVVRSRAEVLRGTGNLEAALDAQRKARELNPHDPVGHLQEGVLLDAMGRRTEAMAAAEQALTLKPDLTGAQQLLGALTYRTGEIGESARLMAEARRAGKAGIDPNHHQALSLFGLGRINELMALTPAIHPTQRFGETMVKAIAAWLDNDPQRCGDMLIEAQPLAGNAAIDAPNRSVFIVYGAILDGLLSWRRDNPDSYGREAEQTFHVIGDSHVLTAANLTLPVAGVMTRLKSHFTFGCKAWHLVRDEPSPYRSFFQAAADGIPASSTVVAGYGELDCRYKEGIMRVVRNNPARDWRALVDDLVPRYVAFVMAEAERRGWTLWLQTPPMSNVNTSLLLTDDRLAFLGIIERFNERLRAEAEAHKLPLIDVKAATTTPKRTPRHTHYIDTNQVRPTALIEALRLMTL